MFRQPIALLSRACIPSSSQPIDWVIAQIQSDILAAVNTSKIMCKLILFKPKIIDFQTITLDFLNYKLHCVKYIFVLYVVCC